MPVARLVVWAEAARAHSMNTAAYLYAALRLATQESWCTPPPTDVVPRPLMRLDLRLLRRLRPHASHMHALRRRRERVQLCCPEPCPGIRKAITCKLGCGSAHRLQHGVVMITQGDLKIGRQITHMIRPTVTNNR